MRVLVCGDREWTDKIAIRWVLSELREQLDGQLEICNGACRGADKLSTEVARTLGIAYQEFPAKWDEFGKGAGPIRNRQMLKEFAPELVLAFHGNIRESKGTKDMLLAAKQSGVRVRLYDYDGLDPEGGNL